jgi:hypothetical protein
VRELLVPVEKIAAADSELRDRGDVIEARAGQVAGSRRRWERGHGRCGSLESDW